MSLAEELLDILVCPVTRSPLRLAGDELISDAAALAFPVREGTPILIVEEARALQVPRRRPGPSLS